MSGKEALIEKILLYAKEQTDIILSESKAKADEIINNAQTEAEKFKLKELSNAEDFRSSIEKRRTTVANLEVRKIMLAAKQEVINAAFAEGMEILNSLPSDKYKSIIFSMLKSQAQDKDVVTISKKDKDILTAEFIAECAKKLAIKLSLNKEFGNFNGGIILSGGNYDKNLTFDVELSSLREEIEPEVVKIIFSGDK